MRGGGKGWRSRAEGGASGVSRRMSGVCTRNQISGPIVPSLSMSHVGCKIVFRLVADLDFWPSNRRYRITVVKIQRKD